MTFSVVAAAEDAKTGLKAWAARHVLMGRDHEVVHQLEQVAYHVQLLLLERRAPSKALIFSRGPGECMKQPRGLPEGLVLGPRALARGPRTVPRANPGLFHTFARPKG